MQNLLLAATATSPEVNFDFERHTLSLKGESYPENAAMFYSEVISRLREYLGACTSASVTVNVALTYFNSSSTKMLFSMFDALNDAAQNGNHVSLNWFHDVDDETMLEFGQELHADFDAIDFVSHAITTG